MKRIQNKGDRNEKKYSENNFNYIDIINVIKLWKKGR